MLTILARCIQLEVRCGVWDDNNWQNSTTSRTTPADREIAMHSSFFSEPIFSSSSLILTALELLLFQFRDFVAQKEACVYFYNAVNPCVSNLEERHLIVLLEF